MNRIITALVALPGLIAAIVLPYFFPNNHEFNLFFVAIAAAAIVLALYEYFMFTKTMQLRADAALGFLGSAAFFVAFLFDAPTKAPDVLVMTLALFIVAAVASQAFRFQRAADFSKMLAAIGVTVLGVFYIAFLGGYFVALRVGFENHPNLSTKLLVFLFLILMGADAAALYIGKMFGKHKLAPKISPGKTWEGGIGGLVVSLLLALIASLTFFTELEWFVALPLAAVMMIVGVVGDLAESAIKRGANAKDAATLLPGHGGLLDRLDSLLFNAPLLYYFARFYFQ
jgi:phosphatidate cytidylyltransferase